MNPFHDRLDLKLHVEHYTEPLCGSLNLATHQAEYCAFDCPVLRERMARGEDVTVPLNPHWPEPRA